MKKLYILSAIILSLTGCSSDQVEDIAKPKLVEVSFGVKASQNEEGQTRLYMGSVEGEKVRVTFEPKDQMDVFDTDQTSHIFVCKDETNEQVAHFRGTWLDDETRWAVIFPSLGGNSVTLGTGSVGNIYNFYLTNEQQSAVVVNNTMVTADRHANVYIGARSTKDVNQGVVLSPVTTSLYFYSLSDNVTITSSSNSIAGQVQLTTNRKNTEGRLEDDEIVSYVCHSNIKEITARGVHVKRNSTAEKPYNSNIYEYVVCLVPGTYPSGTLTIGNVSNNEDLELKRDVMYYIGNVDPTPIGGDNN